MHRIDADGAVAGLFSMGDPGIGAPATQVDADWANAVQENICAFIESMGITLAKGTHTQLRDAVNAILARANTWTAAQVFSAAVTLSAALAADLNLGNHAIANVARMLLQQLTSDPSSPPDGTIWYRNDLHKFRGQINGAPQTLGVEGAGSLVAVSLNANWTGGGLANDIRYWKDTTDEVHLRGWLQAGVANLFTTAFTLPAGFRPGGTRHGPVSCHDSGVYSVVPFYVTTAGACAPLGTSAPNDRLYYLDNFHFLAEA